MTQDTNQEKDNSILAYIHGVQWRGQKPGLERISALLAHLGHPEQSLRFVHIGGTNGKGSTAAMIASVLQTAGYRTGLYTSPFLDHFHERIRVNGREITDAELAFAVNAMRPFADRMPDLPSEFELITAAAMVHFARKGCDIVVLEVGLGGEFDATNAIPCPECAVFTPISPDHTDVLGSTLTEIARTKAGIIKEGGDVVTSTQPPEVTAQLQSVCSQRHARLYRADDASLRLKSAGSDGRDFDLGNRELHIPFPAAYQVQNAATAVTALDVLVQKGWHISERDIYNGLAAVRWPGRLELLQSHPVFLLDGSHNPQGMRATTESLTELYPGRKFIFLLSVMADKDVSAMLPPLLPLADRFFTVTAANPRALPAVRLAEQLRTLGASVCALPSVEAGVQASLNAAGSDGIICALGTLYFSGDVRRALLQKT